MEQEEEEESICSLSASRYENWVKTKMCGTRGLGMTLLSLYV